MSWWGKALGGAFGFMIGGPLGALMGIAFGHNFDRGMNKLGNGDWQEEQERIQAVVDRSLREARVLEKNGRLDDALSALSPAFAPPSRTG